MFTLFRKVNEVVCYIGQCCSGLISQAVRTLNNSAFVLLLEVHLCDPFRCYLIHLRDVDSQISSSDLILIVNWIFMHEWFSFHHNCLINSVFAIEGDENPVNVINMTNNHPDRRRSLGESNRNISLQNQKRNKIRLFCINKMKLFVGLFARFAFSLVTLYNKI